MKHVFTSPLRASSFRKQVLAALMFVSIISLSVPPAAFAEGTDTGTENPPAQTQQAESPAPVVETPSADPAPENVTPPEEPEAPAEGVTGDTPKAPEVTETSETPEVTNEETPGDEEAGTFSRLAAPQTLEVEVPPPGSCTLVSDTNTLHEGLPSMLVSPIHVAWTAIITGASWIWGENPINPADAVNDTTETFTKTFTLSGAPTSASFTIAADNSYTASINGIQFASDSGEFNYTSADTVTVVIPTVNLVSGTNTLTVTVKNFAMSGGTMETNPAGLLYKLTIDGSNCTTPPPAPDPITIHATKIVCNNESDLPNWGTGGHTIDANTATNFLSSHPGCHLESGWEFEWGPDSAGDAGDSFIGPAGAGYTTFGLTDVNGVATTQIPFGTPGTSNEIHLREVLKPGYIPFTFGTSPDNSASTSAEFYCANDALNYDNWDYIRGPQAGATYYCVAFNAPTQQPVNTSTVKMCKVDDQFNFLPGWTLMLKGAHVGSVAVQPDGTNYSLASVPAGNYILTASGAYIYRPGDAAASTSDAAYSLRLPSDSVYGGSFAPWVRENDFPMPYTGWLGITFNNALTNWGSVFHPDHVYALGTTLASTQNMDFKILDDQYGDNSGSMNVDVDHGYVGVTGQDGCVIFENVPYGSYTAEELNQPGWTPVSGTGPVTVNEPQKTVTVSNHHEGTVVPPTKYKVHIFKYLQNGEAPAAQVPNDSGAPQFPMLTTFTISGTTSTDVPYVLGNAGGGTGGSDDGLVYAANTSPLSAGDSYATHEVTGEGSVVVGDVGSCSPGKYYLKGYKVGTTLPAAESASLSTTAPNFPSIASDEYVIVVNAACPQGGDDGDGEPTTTTDTVVVRAANLAADSGEVLADISKWFFYNDNTDVINNSLGSFVTGPSGVPLPTGSAQITLDATNNRTNLATYGFSGTKLEDITALGFSAYSHSGVAGPAESPYLVFNVDFNGSDTWQSRLVFVPSDNGAVPQDTWNTYDAIDGGTAMWQYSGTVWPVAAAGSPDYGVSEFGTVARSWDDILADYPDVRIRVTDSLVGVRVGEPGPASYIGNIDAFVIGITDGSNATTTTYDFEPTAITPTITNNGGGGGGNSRRSGGSVLGVSTTTEPQGQVLGATCGPILSSFLRIGRSNPVDQVTILQNFLNGELMMNLPVTGFFGPLTEKAVETFQAKYFSDVLTPWVPHGLPGEHAVTGYVYKTTQWKINMISCPSLNLPMPLLP